MSDDLNTSKRMSFGAILLGALTLCFLWLFVWQQVEYERKKTLEQASSEAMNLAKAFEENVRSIISQVDYDILTIRRAYEKTGPTSPVVEAILEQTRNDPARVQAGITDEHGRFIVSSDEKALMADFSDRAWFKRSRDNQADTLMVNQTVAGKYSIKGVIPLSRRIVKEDGSFGGVVQIGINSAYFEDVFKRLELGSGGVMTLTGLDGIIRVRQSRDSNDFGQDIRQGGLWRNVQQKPINSILVRSSVDGIDRLQTYRVMPDYPLFIVVGTSAESVFALWEERKNNYVLGAIIVSFGIILVLLLLLDRLRWQRKETSRLLRNAKVQTVLKEIAEAAMFTVTLPELYAAVHRQVEKVLPAEYFHINLLDKATGEILVPYSAVDAHFIPARRPMSKGMAEYIIKQGKAIRASFDELARLRQSGDYVPIKDQAVDYHQYLGAPLTDSQGKIFGVMSLILLDKAQTFQPDAVEVFSIIAAQVSLAIERKKAADELRKSNILLEQSFMQSPIPQALVSTPDGIIRITNPAIQKFLGISEEPSLIGTPLNEVKPSWQDFDMLGKKTAMEDWPLARSLKGQKTEIEERCIIRKDGSIGYELASSGPILDDSGQVIAGYLAMMDVTELMRRQQQDRHDLQLATRVQRAMLILPEKSDYIDITPVYQPHHYVGGDLFFLDWRYGGKLLRGFIIDVTGHGLGTALHTASLHVLLREVNEQDLPLADAMRWLNRRVCGYFDDGTFAGAVGFELDIETRQLRWSCAGMPEVWMDTREIKGAVARAGLFLGILEDETFDTHTLDIEVGDSFYFMTDGLGELVSKHTQLPLDRFAEMAGLLKNTATKPDRKDDGAAICIHVRALPKRQFAKRDGLVFFD